MSKDKPLCVYVRDGELRIAIGIDALAHAIANGNDFYRFDETWGEYVRGFAITESAKFAEDVARELQREAEDGSSLLTKLIDEAGQAAIDDGSEGVEYHQAIKFGERSELEKW